jgi:hypothetical protein
MFAYSVGLHIIRGCHLYVSNEIEEDAQQERLHSTENIPNFGHRRFDDSNHYSRHNTDYTEKRMVIERRRGIRYQNLRHVAVQRGDGRNEKDTTLSSSLVEST